LVPQRRYLAACVRGAVPVAFAALALGGCGSSDGEIDDPALPYSFSYPKEFEEGGKSTVSAREQGFDNQVIVAKETGQDLISIQTQPLRRTVTPKLVPRVKREVEHSARRTGKVQSKRDVRVAGLEGVEFRMSLRGTGVPVQARWIYAAKDRTLYWINCQWQTDRATVSDACDVVRGTFKTR
jgi:hypothetical protein